MVRSKPSQPKRPRRSGTRAVKRKTKVPKTKIRAVVRKWVISKRKEEAAKASK